MKEDDFKRFARGMRLAVHHYRKGNCEGEEDEWTAMPWDTKSTFEPKPLNKNLETFLHNVHQDIFSMSNSRYVEDNLSIEERQVLNNLREWNRDAGNPRMFRIQDKGARFTIEWKEDYERKVEEYLQDTRIFREDEGDQSTNNKEVVRAWAEKWKAEGVIDREMKEWIIPSVAKPAHIHANLKTHKKNVPYRHIVSLFGTATENLARWSEVFLKEHAQKHPAYLRDTKDFLAYIEDINIRKAPFEELSTIITSRDITNYYPSCDLEKSIEAVGQVLRRDHIEEKKIQCLQEAVRITMTRNNIMFKGRHYTQIDGATIGGPNSGSVTDIFGCEFIDKKIEECPYSIEEYKRYRDDTFDVNTNSSLEEQQLVTEWLNQNIYEDKITFTEVSSQVAVEFMDVKAVLHGDF